MDFLSGTDEKVIFLEEEIVSIEGRVSTEFSMKFIDLVEISVELKVGEFSEA